MHWLQSLDVGLFRFVNQSLSNPLFDGVMPWLSGNAMFVPLLLLGGVALIWRWRLRGLLCVVMLSLVISLGDPLVLRTLKHAVGRPRPFVALQGVRLPANSNPDRLNDGNAPNSQENGNAPTERNARPTSMPSAHAANWFAVTFVMYLYFRRSAWLLLPLAALVSFSRVYNGVHYPSDVLAGALLGAGYAAAFALGINSAWRWAGRNWFPLWWAQLPSLVRASGVPLARLQAGDQAHVENRPATIEAHWLRAGGVLIVMTLLGRWIYLASGVIGLSEDEAYQWLWSKHLALSYYSKPPLIAYTQFLGTALWGDTAFGVRFFSPLIGAVLGWLMLRWLAREVGAKTGFVMLLVVNTTPVLAAGATLLTVDSLLVLFWTAAMLAGWRAIQPDAGTKAWLWVGLWSGLAFLSKYAALFQWVCWGLFFLLSPTARRHLRRPGPYLALLISLAFTLPVVLWNHQHGWVTLEHVAMDNAKLGESWRPTLRYLYDFVGNEFGIWNPVFFVGALWAAVGFWRCHRSDARMTCLFSMGAPVFVACLLYTLHSRVQANWPATSVLPLLCLMVIYWGERWRSGARFVKPALLGGLALGLAALVVMHDTDAVEKITGYPLPTRFDPLVRVRGWKDAAEVVGRARARLLAEGKPVFLIGGHYGIASLVAFHLPEARAAITTEPLVFSRPSPRPANQFHLWPGYEHRPGQNAIFFAERNQPRPAPEMLISQFETVTDLGLHHALHRGRVFHTLQLFECRNLR